MDCRGAGIDFVILGILCILDLTEIPTGSMQVVINSNDVVIRDKDMNMSMDMDKDTKDKIRSFYVVIFHILMNLWRWKNCLHFIFSQ
jgi:hypothetical protein